jgi:hypothetical protein
MALEKRLGLFGSVRPFGQNFDLRYHRAHSQELTRCQAELPRHQHQLDALGRELREKWGVEEPK